MLTDLSIRNFAIIDNLHIAFHSGLNILTGETGAGKSIIIDAVNLILGGRASTDLIRSGEEEAQVEALFDLSGSPDVAAAMADSGIDQEGELLIKRTISRSGKNRVFLNGSLATTSQLADIAPRLINIYGQHESQSLLRLSSHIELLDSYGILTESRRAYKDCYTGHQQISSELRTRDQESREASRRLDLLCFQAEEITSAALLPGEDEELERERALLIHADRLLQGTGSAYGLLYGDDGSLLSRLAEIRRMLADCAAVDPSLSTLDSSLADVALQVEDIALTLRDYSSRIDADPQRLQDIDDRVHTLQTLKKKYAPSIEEILNLKVEIDREIEALRMREEHRGELEKRQAELADEMLRRGSRLSSQRKEAAGRLAAAMTGELQDLAMKNALFITDIQPLAEPGPLGLDRVEFLFSPNQGEPPRPLARIASGGELSRLMLALKQIHPDSDVPSLIFDEVDTGIGGSVSALVGEKLRNVARQQQVLCITHLPQVAVYADHHFRVEKQVNNDRTSTSVRILDATARIDEISRMLSGMTITETTRQHAREMLQGVHGPTP